MTDPAAEHQPLDPAQRAVVTTGLPHAATASNSAPVHVDDATLDRLITWAGRERLDGLLWTALTAGEIVHRPDTASTDDPTAATEHAVGSSPEPSADRLRQRAQDAHLAGLRSSLSAEAAGAAAIAILDDAGIDVVVFKGLANAHLDYDRPELRTFFDGDLLVSRDRFGAAIDALVAAGFHRSAPPLRTRWEQRFARAAELRSPAGVEIDLHAAVATGYFGERLDHEALRCDGDRIDVAGREFHTFGPSARLLVSSYAVVLSRGFGIRLLRDLAQQLLVTGADWEQAAHLAGDGDIVLARGLLAVHHRLGVDHDAVEWARTVTPTPRAARALAHADDAHERGWSADARSTLLALGPRERVAFLAGVVLPSRDSLRSRGRTITGHLTRRRSHRNVAPPNGQPAAHDR